MRERKYRSWDNIQKQMVYYSLTDMLSRWESHNMEVWPGWNNVMDYINLKDRNEKEIFEHDLITLYPGGSVRLVIWQDQYSGWVAQKKMEDNSKHVVFFYNQKEKNNTIEIVGNLYEHPELWKSELT